MMIHGIIRHSEIKRLWEKDIVMKKILDINKTK